MQNLPIPKVENVPVETPQILRFNPEAFVQEKEEEKVEDDEEAAELRELLESMTEEERSEFLRLSGSRLPSELTPADAIAVGSI